MLKPLNSKLFTILYFLSSNVKSQCCKMKHQMLRKKPSYTYHSSSLWLVKNSAICVLRKSNLYSWYLRTASISSMSSDCELRKCLNVIMTGPVLASGCLKTYKIKIIQIISNKKFHIICHWCVEILNKYTQKKWMRFLNSLKNLVMTNHQPVRTWISHGSIQYIVVLVYFGCTTFMFKFICDTHLLQFCHHCLTQIYFKWEHEVLYIYIISIGNAIKNPSILYFYRLIKALKICMDL